MGDVVSLAKHADDGMMWSPRDMLEDTLDKLDAGTLHADKALLMLLDNSDGQAFSMSFVQAGISHVQLLGYLELLKQHIIDSMRGG